MKQRCIYCGSRAGTKDHIIPKSLLKDLELFSYEELSVPTNNTAPCCRACNLAKHHKLIVPTTKNMRTAYMNTPTIYIKSVIKWIVSNKNILRKFFEDKDNRAFYNVELTQINAVISLYDSKYYKIKRSRKASNSGFNREYITLK